MADIPLAHERCGSFAFCFQKAKLLYFVYKYSMLLKILEEKMFTVTIFFLQINSVRGITDDL